MTDDDNPRAALPDDIQESGSFVLAFHDQMEAQRLAGQILAWKIYTSPFPPCCSLAVMVCTDNRTPRAYEGTGATFREAHSALVAALLSAGVGAGEPS